MIIHILISEAYLESSRISEKELFAKIVNGIQSLTIFAKPPILDVRRVSEYVSKNLTYIYTYDDKLVHYIDYIVCNKAKG